MTRDTGTLTLMGISVEVRNLGPLVSAQIDLGRLNVLVGENNAGKSFFATVLHRVAAASRPPSALRRSDFDDMPGQFREFLSQVLPLASLKEQDKTAAAFQPDGDTIRWLEAVAKDLLTSLGGAIRQELADAYSIRPSALRRMGPNGLAVESYLEVTSAGESEDLSWSLKIAFGDGSDHVADDSIIDGIEAVPPDPGAWLKDILDHGGMRLATRQLQAERIGMVPEPADITNACWRLLSGRGRSRLTRGFPWEAMHLPAERNGIMQNGRVLLSRTLPELAGRPERKRRSPHLTRTTVDLLDHVYLSSSDVSNDVSDSEPARLAAEFERELGASVELDDDGQTMPTVVVVTPEGRFPLVQTSAMLSELAPLLLIAKHRLDELDWLTVDEPEAHLHPDIQRRIASFLVQLADADVTVILTTHSNFFVGQLNNHIRAHALAQLRSPPECSPAPEIDPSQVRALWFSRGEDGCIAESIPIDPVDGISQSVFTDAMRELHIETAATINPLLESSVD